ncbi:MAG: cell division topological specificity factor MinE [Chloroflexi bacterium]|jgi:cell division topological specificity factor|nr:cell division topological specificity factor MinE [Chloroflexota bacterium]MBT3668789.1 cell division topological specificity factor MinE [Chloroflexota bacterium]MBT4002899.1 cell division topological specificity factor MinE [Chloroflexota bacterium]MBT4306790.1 cell division topological specificity factor MinE [Chloroflexota bacterium]MBT4534600.1 cell division topological specificity factor MinE [Chloroflexota bacterium]
MRSLFGRKEKSASAAKERLKLVLIHDRTDLPPGMMEDLRDELIEVISRHIDVDREMVSIEIAQDGRNQRLVADIPLQTPKRRRSR